ncbi:MAG TPA: hypothetical protein VGI77_08495 [Gaiellaceae bacterium]|jgi:hypothetical protein
MAMTSLHRFTRLLLWRLVGICTMMLVASWIVGAGSVWQIVEWVPMTIAIVLVVSHLASFIRQRG